MNRGSPRPGRRDIDQGLASMRPRFMNRGSGVLPLELRDLGAASMRPRFMNRGSGINSPRIGATKLLQ